MRKDSAQYDVIILGAGAAGLWCAAAAGARGRRVLVLEKANKVGKKILMSGGGRCNFTNYFVEADNFISGNPHFCKSALSRYTQWDFIAMVERHGIEYEERKHGQLFCKNSASDILNMLLQECDKANVTIATHCDITAVKSIARAMTQNASDAHEALPDQPDARYQVDFDQGPQGARSQRQLYCESLVVATGALSIPTLGGSGLGYDIAAQFSLPLTARRAGLVPFMFSDAMKPICARLSGVAVEVAVSCNGQSLHRKPAVYPSGYQWPGDFADIKLLVPGRYPLGELVTRPR